MEVSELVECSTAPSRVDAVVRIEVARILSDCLRRMSMVEVTSLSVLSVDAAVVELVVQSGVLKWELY